MERTVTLWADKEEIVRDLLFRELGLSFGLLAKIKNIPNGLTQNGVPVFVTAKVNKGDEVRVILESGEDYSENIFPEKLPLRMIYEDEDILILDKPAGMPVHPSKGHIRDSLANGIVGYYAEKGLKFTFRCVNRLDKDTSGLVAVAKNAYTHHKLTEQMNTGELKRTYLALAEGIVTPSEGTVETDIRRIPGRATIKREVCPDGQGEKAITQYRVLERINGRSLLKIQLETGRTHQIRVHFSHLGYPLTGDWLYGREQDTFRQALHSAALRLVQPLTKKELFFSSPLPEDFLLMVNAPETGE